MRRERHGQGRGRGNGGGRGRGQHGRSSGGRSGGRGRRPQQRASYDSGNHRERIAIESGALVFIDQFMLANPEFIKKINDIIDEGPEEKDRLVHQFGGQVVELEPGTYRIERDPFKFSIIIHPEGEETSGETFSKDDAKSVGHVFVDTRCIAMIDRELLDDSGLLEKYQQLWFSGQDKACRDLLRDNGGAVRYGFSRNSDDLGVYLLEDDNIVGLWPDITESEGALANEA